MISLAHKVIDSIEAMIKTTPNGGWCRANVGMDKNNVQIFHIKGDNLRISTNSKNISNNKRTTDLTGKSLTDKVLLDKLINVYGLTNIFNTRFQLDEELVKTLSKAKKEVDMICGDHNYKDFYKENYELINNLKGKGVVFKIYDLKDKMILNKSLEWLITSDEKRANRIIKDKKRPAKIKLLPNTNEEILDYDYEDFAELFNENQFLNFYCRIDDIIYINLYGPQKYNKHSLKTISFSFQKGIVYDIYYQFFKQLWKEIMPNSHYERFFGGR